MEVGHASSSSWWRFRAKLGPANLVAYVKYSVSVAVLLWRSLIVYCLPFSDREEYTVKPISYRSCGLGKHQPGVDCTGAGGQV